MTIRAKDLVGPGEVADMFGVSSTLVSQWRKRGKLPKPIAVLKMGPVWTRSQFADRLPCQHPPARLFAWRATDGTQCVACRDCKQILAGAA